MIPVGTKVVYDGTDTHSFGITKGDMGFVSADEPLVPDGSTVVVEFRHPTQDRMFVQEIDINSVRPVE